MTNLTKFDFDQVIDKLDTQNSFGSIEQLGDQIQHVWATANQVQFDQSYQNINQVVVIGMGGSALGTHVIQAVFKDELTVPVIISSDYTVPNYVDDQTLVIASSYSGTTEETLAATQDAIKKGAKITGISSGGKLAKLLKTHHYPALIFDPKYNPSNQPRMALGYSIFGQVALFSQAGLLTVTENDYRQVLATIAQLQLSTSRQIESNQNLAKMLAFNLVDRLPVIAVSEHLEGSAHIFANQLNENAKQYSEFRVIPELNHHLMEGLKFPESNPKNLFFLTVDSDLYLDSNRTRIRLTEQVLEKNNITYLHHQLESSTKLSQAFELILLGSYTVNYLTMLNHLDPSPIPWVNWFKEQLKNHN